MTSLSDVVAVSAVRSPMGKFGGTMRDLPVIELGGQVIASACKRIGFDAAEIDSVILGNCRQAGNGTNPARIAAQLGGVHMGTFAQTINCACPSGLKTIIVASEELRLGDSSFVLAGGMESMSTIPYLLTGHRWNGFRLGDVRLMDGWNDTIDKIANVNMGQTAENVAEKYGITREDQDEFAAGSHQKASRAQKTGVFKNEIVPIRIPAAKTASEIIFEEDESIRHDASLEKLGKLAPVFKKGGTVTAGNACGMTDGASAIILTTREKAGAMGLKPLFSLVGYGNAAVDNAYMGIGPTASISKAQAMAGMSKEDIDFIEINEAFAAASLVCERILGLDHQKVNVNGGAIALGHPTGCSGARLVVSLYNILKTRDAEYGIASLCGGGGVSCALIIKREL